MVSRKPASKKVRVTVAHPFQVGYDGKVYGPSEQVTVPAELAAKWEASNLGTR